MLRSSGPLFVTTACTTFGSDAPPLAPEDEPLNIVTFTEVDGRTTLEILVQTTSRELRDLIVGSGMESGMQESMDRLEQVAVSLR